MSLKMRDEDRQAVDLVMDRIISPKGVAKYAATESRLRDRVMCVEKVLGHLEEMPITEPSQDLVARTLRFVETAGQHGGARSRAAQHGFMNQPPVA